MVKLKTELRNSASYYLGHSQKIIGTYEQSLKRIQDLGINYTNLLFFFLSNSRPEPIFYDSY